MKKCRTTSNTGLIKSTFTCSRDNLIIRGTQYRPTSNLLPAAIVSHGFMANQNTVRHYTRCLAQIGYSAYCFDFNGGSAAQNKSSGASTDMSVLTEVADLEAVIDYVTKFPYIDTSRLLLMGCSQGGLVTALAAAKRKDQVSKLVLFYPAFCIPDDARSGNMMFAHFDPCDVPEQFRCGPMKLGKRYVTDVLDMEPFAAIKSYPGPVLILHGTQDTVVPPEYAYRAYSSYRSRPNSEGSVQLNMIEGGSHGFSRLDDVAAMKRLIEFAAF